MGTRILLSMLVLSGVTCGLLSNRTRDEDVEVKLLEAELRKNPVQRHQWFVERKHQAKTLRDEYKCPDMWFVKGNDGECQCGSDVTGKVLCNPDTKEIAVIDCSCITPHFTGKETIFVVGDCIFNCINVTKSNGDNIYFQAPSDCSSLNRNGTLCGQCIDGYVLPPYTYDFKCIKCNNNNWWLYAIYAFLPLSVFIICILVFRVSVFAPKIHVYVFAAQNISCPQLLRTLVVHTGSLHNAKLLVISMYITTSVHGIWNLDFFRIVLPELCLNIPPLQTLALDYLIAFYPMLLMGIAYTIVELHGRGFRPMMYIWRPFHRHLVQFRHQWGIQTTIMDAFVTFFILSTTKLFSVSFDLLVPTRLFTPKGDTIGVHLYYDPSIKYFSSDHLPFALLALSVLAVFIILPLSLWLFYQCKFFRNCLTKCRLKGRVLDEFVNTSQKYYKDGTDGTMDCRWYAGFYIIVKAFIYLAYAVCLNGIAYLLLTCTYVVASTVPLIVHPYKHEYAVFNTIDSIFLLWQGLFCMLLASADLSSMVDRYFSLLTHFCAGIISLVPFVYIIGVVLHHLFKRYCNRKSVLLNNEAEEASTSSLPDRLLRSNQYRDSFGHLNYALST